MAALWVAFITGITTGGLSCMAVQGGLLASSLANQIEKDLSIPSKKIKKASAQNCVAHPAFPGGETCGLHGAGFTYSGASAASFNSPRPCRRSSNSSSQFS